MIRSRSKGSSAVTTGTAFRREYPRDLRRALGQADRIVAAGQPMDALRVLTEANRRRRDPRIEQRILDLRFESFEPEASSAARPQWPDVIDDLFPGERIPDIPRDDLTVELLRSGIMRHGSVLVRGLANKEQVDLLIGDIDKTFAAYDALANGAPRGDRTTWFEQCAHDRSSDRKLKRAAGAVLAVDSPPTLFDLIEVFDAVGIRRLAQDYFGEPPTLLAKKTTLRRVDHDANTGDWHQDGAFMGTDIRSLNVWLSLSHCGDDAPGIDIVGRRLDELVTTGTDGAYFDWSVGRLAAERAAAGAIVRPIFEPGDAILFDQMNLHRTAVDPKMNRNRYAIETWLFSPSTYDAMTASDEQKNAPRDQLPVLF